MEEDKVELRKKSAMSIAALVLGIISIVTNLFWYMCLPTGILAIVFGAKTTKKIGSKLGKAGLITGIIGVSLCLFIYAMILILIILSNIY